MNKRHNRQNCDREIYREKVKEKMLIDKNHIQPTHTQGRIEKKISEGVLGMRCRRRRGRVATRPRRRTRLEGWGMGRGVYLRSRLGVWGSVVSSPSGVRGGFGALYSCQKAPRSNHFEYFEVHVFH